MRNAMPAMGPKCRTGRFRTTGITDFRKFRRTVIYGHGEARVMDTHPARSTIPNKLRKSTCIRFCPFPVLLLMDLTNYRIESTTTPAQMSKTSETSSICCCLVPHLQVPAFFRIRPRVSSISIPTSTMKSFENLPRIAATKIGQIF